MLAPLYAHSMSAAEFGRVGIAATVNTLVITALSFGLHTTTYRLHHDFADETERGEFYFSIVCFLAIAAISAVGLGEVALFVGVSPLENLPATPHLQLVLAASFFGVFHALPVNVFVAREEPARAARLNLVTLASTVAANVWFVVWLGEESVGQLKALLVANVVVAAAGLVAIRRQLRFTFSVEKVRRGLAFSVPLLPHLLSMWGLAVADRLVLERWVTPKEIGIYQLSATFGIIVTVVIGALMRGLYPMIARKIARNEGVNEIPALGTISVFLMVATGVTVMVSAGDIVAVLFPFEYQACVAYVPWLVAAAVFQGIYQLVMQGSLQAKKTRMVSVVSGLALAVNLGLTVLLVDELGVLAAAIATVVAFALLAVMHGIAAHRAFPIPWEYGRWARLFIAAGASLWMVLAATSAFERGVLSGCVRVLLGLAALLVTMVALRVVGWREVPAMLRNVRGPRRNTGH